MKNLKTMQHPWPLRKRNHYGHESPVESLLSRIIGGIKRQLADREKREEAKATLLVCAIVSACLLFFWLALPGAIGHEIDHGRAVVAESRGER